MSELKSVGQSVLRKDSWDKVSGAARYAADMTLPGTLHMQILFAGIPHGRILKIDTIAAEKQPGVVAILTAADVPVNKRGLVTLDQPVFCDDKVRYVGDQIGAVVAETSAQAAAAARLVKIEYAELPIISDPIQALQPGQVLVQEEKAGNICNHIAVETGDVAAAFAAADLILEREFFTPMQEHAYLEPEAGLAYIDDDGRVTVRTSGQCTHDDLRQIAAALDLPEERVRVIYGTIGGAFGGREDVSVQIALALAAWKLGRPVRTVWSREESIKGHGKRHAITIHHKWGAKKDGTILGAEVTIISDAGAYNFTSGEVLTNFRYAAIGAYEIPNVKISGTAVFTNNVPGCAFRGFGSPQGTFAAEMMIGQLGQALDLDPVTIRARNGVQEGSILATQSKVPAGVSLPVLLKTCAEAVGAEQRDGRWQLPKLQAAEPHKRRGIGLAAAMKNSGFGWGFPEGSDARVVLHGGAAIEQAQVYTAAADVGQGAHSVLAQIAAEVLDIPVERVQMITSDTASSGNSGPASASRLTMFAGNAVKQAAEEALSRWQNEDRPAEGGGWWTAPATTAPDPLSGACFNSISYAYGVQAVELDVDMETGEIEILSVTAVHDPGKAINPDQVIGQLEGGIIQAQGWALTEDFITRGGYIQTDRLSTYLIPTAMDAIPEIRCILIDVPDAVGPYGVRGVGEIGLVPLAPAIAAAVHDATGVWFNQIPLKPERVAAGLHAF